MKKLNNRKTLIYTAGIATLLMVTLILCLCFSKQKNVPILRVETPQKPSASQKDTFSLDVTVSSLGEGIYPAMSASIRFDPAYLEFVGIEEGNLFITDPELGKALPQWSCNPEQCNKTGLINVMYLDLTGGKAAFSRNLMEDGDHVVFSLSFRLRGSARSGDVYQLTVEDTVFAASDESQSLATANHSLKVKNGKIVVGD
jgi:hypothetical protein